MSTSGKHPGVEALVDYWFGDLDPAQTDSIDEHLMACDECGLRVDALAALGQGVRAAVDAGRVSALTGAALLDRLKDHGLRVREYRLEHNGNVNCTVAPDDDVLVARLEAPLAGVQRLDFCTSWSLEPQVEHRVEDVPFDPRSGEVVYLANAAQAKLMPAHTMIIRLVAHGADGEWDIGSYTFNHSPWGSGP